MRVGALLVGAAVGGVLVYALTRGATRDAGACGKWQILRRIGGGAYVPPVGGTATLKISRGGAPAFVLVHVTRHLKSGDLVGRVVSGPAWGPPAGFAVQFAPADVGAL